jgi:hypothetical protein
LPDWRAISPGFFDFSPGVAQSQAVSSGSDEVVEATIAANYQANGGAIHSM